jgi:hypothetical protein
MISNLSLKILQKSKLFEYVYYDCHENVIVYFKQKRKNKFFQQPCKYDIKIEKIVTFSNIKDMLGKNSLNVHLLCFSTREYRGSQAQTVCTH